MGLCLPSVKLTIFIIVVLHSFCCICFASPINARSGSAHFRSRRVIYEYLELCLFQNKCKDRIRVGFLSKIIHQALQRPFIWVGIFSVAPEKYQTKTLNVGLMTVCN